MSVDSGQMPGNFRLPLKHESSGFNESLAWLQDYRSSIDFSVDRIPFSESNEWAFDDERTFLGHRSKKFFAVRGYRHPGSDQKDSCQPLIDQPETGTQGFVVRWNGSSYDLLAQARTEPGNIGVVQIGPTIQATFSNYTTVHGGKRPKFLDWFHNPEAHRARVIIDTTQPELGTRFLKKWNRNIVIECSQLDDFCDPMFHWIRLEDFAKLMQSDHIVNNDARLVFGLLALERGQVIFDRPGDTSADAVTASIGSLASKSFQTFDELLNWRAAQQSPKIVGPETVALHSLAGWQIDDHEIGRQNNDSIAVQQFRVKAGDREVESWDQPLIASKSESSISLCYSDVDGCVQLLMQATTQIGNDNGPLLQPTYCQEDGSDSLLPEFLEKWLTPENQLEKTQIKGSDEGGAFFSMRQSIPADSHQGIPSREFAETLLLGDPGGRSGG